MECERCHQRPATVHFTEIINNQKRTLSLCEPCAREVQTESMGFMPQMNLHHFLAGLFNNEFLAPGFGRQTANEGVKCAACGMTEAQFAQKGLLGCGECYKYFSDRLEPMLRRIHGTSSHTGKVPERTGGVVKITQRIERLKKQLKEAIGQEEFETAAQLRDQIRELEKELHEGV